MVSVALAPSQRGGRVIAGEDECQAPPQGKEHDSQDLCRDRAPPRGQDGADLRGHRGEVDLQSAG